MTWLSMLGWDNTYDERWRGIIPQRDTRVAFTAPVAKAMLRHPVRLCMHSLRALRHCPFTLDVYLWDACHGARALPGTAPARSRLACYRALADHPSRGPSVGDVLAFESDLARLPQLTHDFDDFSSFDSRNAWISLSPIFVIPL